LRRRSSSGDGRPRPARREQSDQFLSPFGAAGICYMELTKKIKLALDETRILILGEQILLDF
jgi:hypothetical protein